MQVVLYENLVDSSDPFSGHGTHVVGSILGQAVDPSSAPAQYDGVAINAKIAFQGPLVISLSAFLTMCWLLLCGSRHWQFAAAAVAARGSEH